MRTKEEHSFVPAASAQSKSEQTKSDQVVPPNKGRLLMLAPLATLAFLTALWGVAAIITHIYARNGSRIAAALRGETPIARGMSLVIRSRPTRARMARRLPMRAQPHLRAAA